MDKPVARFICYDPFGYEVHTESMSLTSSTTVANADKIISKIEWHLV